MLKAVLRRPALALARTQTTTTRQRKGTGASSDKRLAACTLRHGRFVLLEKEACRTVAGNRRGTRETGFDLRVSFRTSLDRCNLVQVKLPLWYICISSSLVITPNAVHQQPAQASDRGHDQPKHCPLQCLFGAVGTELCWGSHAPVFETFKGQDGWRAYAQHEQLGSMLTAASDSWHSNVCPCRTHGTSTPFVPYPAHELMHCCCVPTAGSALGLSSPELQTACA